MENRIKRGVVMCDDKLISRMDLGLISEESETINLRQVRQAAERSAIQRALSMAAGNVSAAAKQLGITRPTLYDLLKKHNIEVSND